MRKREQISIFVSWCALNVFIFIRFEPFDGVAFLVHACTPPTPVRVASRFDRSCPMVNTNKDPLEAACSAD